MAADRLSVAVDEEHARSPSPVYFNPKRPTGDTEISQTSYVSAMTRNTVFTVYSDEDENEIELDDDQSLGCGWKYIGLCVLLPLCNGLTNGFAWSVLFLYFDDMNWPLWHAGLACAVGLLGRMGFQQIQLTFGIWVAIPANLLHLSSCILAVIYTQHEWAILYEIVCIFGLDPTMSIEGIVYDSCKFASSVSRQATSTSLSVMALSVSLAAILGGVLYDFFSWKGIAVMHTSCQGLLLCVLLLQPTTHKSFEDVFCRHRRLKARQTVAAAGSPNKGSPNKGSPNKLVPQPKTSEALFERRSMADGGQAVESVLPGAVPGHVEMAVEEVEDGSPGSPKVEDGSPKAEGELAVPTTETSQMTRVLSGRKTGRRTETARLQEMLDEMEDEEEEAAGTNTAAQPQPSRQSLAVPSIGVKDFGPASPQSAAASFSAPVVPETSDNTDKKVSRGSKITGRATVSGDTGRATVSGRRTQGKVLQGYLDDLDADDLQDEPGKPKPQRPSKQADIRQSAMSVSSAQRLSKQVEIRHSAMSTSRKSVRSTFSRRSTVSRSKAAIPGVPKPVKNGRGSHASVKSQKSWMSLPRMSRKSRQSDRTSKSAGSGVTGGTVGTALSTMTTLVDAGMHFEHHFAINCSLRPKIAARAGRRRRRIPETTIRERPSRERPSAQSQGTDISGQTLDTYNTKGSRATHVTGGSGVSGGTDLTYASAVTHGTLDISWWLPAGTRLPSFLILFTCFASHCSYMIVCSVYALYYREERGWSQAMYAGICQSSGEVLAAGAMRIMSSVNSLINQEEEPSWCITRLYRKSIEKPYDLAWLIFFWACLNACFMLPWVPVAVTAHVLMATVYAFSSKMAMELCLVYAMGDSDIFMTLQDLARRTEAVGAILSCGLGPLMYSMVMPNAPFIVTASLCGVTFLLYTVAFCFGDGIPEEDDYDDDFGDYDYEEGQESE